ncbi:MAG: ATP-dependent zinc metalloprotease FtsH [Patescibacteria group bacterium]
MRSITLRNILVFVLALIIVGAALSTVTVGTKPPQTLGIGELVSEITAGNITAVDIRENKLTATRKDGTTVVSYKEPTESLPTLLRAYDLSPERLRELNIAVKQESGAMAWLAVLLPFLIPLLLLASFIYFMARQVQGANNRAMTFGQSGAREVQKNQKGRTTFKDVAGVREAKEELHEVVEFLKSPKKFTAVGAKIPKGVLLMGSPGTGKTLLARAVAGEANVPFFHISGSEFVEMFVGVGAARVRDLFSRAKKNAPCILFIDEIDAVGRQRGSGLGGSHDEREQTLNQILVEMDGFDPNAGVIVMAATNRPDVLDPALLRPGRFDRRVILDEPTMDDREAILQIHTRGKPLEREVSLRRLAERTPGFSGADLANLLNEGAILAARRGKKTIGMAELLESVEKVMLGPERKSRILSPEERRITAYHEAGHALVAHELTHADPVHKISIISRGHALGYTLKLPTEDRNLRSKGDFIDDLAIALGGYTAEREIFGDNELTTGASNDLRQATKVARRIITEYGMSDALGPRTFGAHSEMIFLGREITEQRDYSEKVAEAIDAEITKLTNAAMKTAQGIIRRERARMEEIVRILLTKETIEQEEFESLFTSHPHQMRAPREPIAPVAPAAREPRQKMRPAPQAA